MRVISGICRGRKLVPIQGVRIRPTSDRVKEAIFNIIGPSIRDASVLDIFSGTGALGIEALSRGAERVVFADIDTRTTLENLRLCRLEERAETIRTDLLLPAGLDQIPGTEFDFIFIDPPYGKRIIEQVLENPAFSKLAHPGSTIFAEHGIKEKIDVSQTGLDIFRQKKYSKTMISIMTPPNNNT